MNIDPKLIDAGTRALMVGLYGEDLGGAASGDAFDGQQQWHREQVTDILAAVLPLIVASGHEDMPAATYTPPPGQKCGHGHDPRHDSSSPLYQRIGCMCHCVGCNWDFEAPAAAA